MNAAAAVRRVVILGAAGRDFHDFNTVFRDDQHVMNIATRIVSRIVVVMRAWSP